MRQKKFLLFLTAFLFMASILLISNARSQVIISGEPITGDVIEFSKPDLRITKISELTFYDGIDGYDAGNMGEMPWKYALYRENKIVFDVTINSRKGVDNISEVYVTLNGEIQADCLNWQKVILNNKTAKYHCEFTVETPSSMYGKGSLDVVAETAEGVKDSRYLGEWYFNPVVALGVDGDVSFLAKPGEIVYTTPGWKNHEYLPSNTSVVLESEMESESNESMIMFISGTNFNLVSDGRSVPIQLLYYAESEGYSTLDDPRADEEGYIPVKFALGLDYPLTFRGDYEIIHPKNKNESIQFFEPNRIGIGDKIFLKFKINVPNNISSESYITGNLYYWGQADYGSSTGVNAGSIDLGINEEPTEI